jgi:hypothetical protein
MLPVMASEGTGHDTTGGGQQWSQVSTVDHPLHNKWWTAFRWAITAAQCSITVLYVQQKKL